MEGDARCTVRVDGDRWILAGELTFDTASKLLASAGALPLPASGVVDCAGVGAVDSAGLAVLLALQRVAAGAGRKLNFRKGPPALATLADLYGVDEVLRG